MASPANLFQQQKSAYQALKNTSSEYRIKLLKKLRSVVVDNTAAIDAALHADLRKPLMGAQHFEINAVLEEIDDAIEHVAQWMEDELVPCSAGHEGSQSRIVYEPRGVCLLFGPWNFPFALTFGPLAQIIAAGNRCIIKPNELQRETSILMTQLINDAFSADDVVSIEGDVSVAESLLQQPFDHIFFTGSPAVGKRVMAAAAQHLSTVTLELGGKCPAIIDDTVDLVAFAQKAVLARFSNAGQLCLSVDHIWVPQAQHDALVAILKTMVEQFFYVDGQLAKERFSRIVDSRNFERVAQHLNDAIAQGAKVSCGGVLERDDLTIPPTVLTHVPLSASIMQDEIFGPLLPILAYDDISEVTAQIDKMGKPLAMYIFSDDQVFVDTCLSNTSSGGVTVNDVLSHHNERNLPFGGVNQSGIGRCHGVYGFKELSNARSVYTK